MIVTMIGSIEGLYIFISLLTLIVGILTVRIFHIKKKVKSQRLEILNLESPLSKADFISNVSHDIRTPLNTIIGISSLASGHLDDHQMLKDDLNKINVSSKHLLNLINSVLDMSKLKSGQIELKNEIVSIRRLLDEALIIFDDEIKRKGQHLNVYSNLDKLSFYTDGLRVKQIFINLISNASKYTKFGGDINIYLNKEIDLNNNCFIRFIIEDTGQGMTQEFLDKLFVPYSRSGQNDTSIEGTGLGTSIVKDIVRLLQGKIDVKSEVGVGTRFDILFPIKICESHDLGLVCHLDDRPLKLSARILVVDDGEINRIIVRTQAQKLGLQVDEADSGLNALELIVTNKYDLILMDVRMPGLNGYDTAKRIRSLGGTYKKIPIITMSADVFPEDKKKAEKSGMNEHIAKPLDLDSITEVLKKWLK